MSSPTSDLVQVNVGGVLYTTTRSTLIRYPDSMLGAMFRGDIPSNCDQNGHYFIDRDGTLFRHVLNFLRCSSLHLPKDFNEMMQLRAEADFYQVQPLIDGIDKIQNSLDVKPGVYIEVKDHIHCYKGWHINTSISGPLDMLRTLSPFKQEITSRACCAWKEGNIMELFLEKCAKTRLDLAISLKKAGWSLVSTTCSSHSKNPTDASVGNESQQLNIIIDKWFLETNLADNLDTNHR
jgi:hypothetical protein